MELDIYIIDDDISIRQIIKNIIMTNQLGNIVGETHDGEAALTELALLKPDIIIVDLLLPTLDGIELVSKAKSITKDMLFVMISQVSAKDMVAKAYEAGIEYFINKPINVNEVVSIMKKVIEKHRLSSTLRYIENAFHIFKNPNSQKIYSEAGMNNDEDKIRLILSQLGILGESGSQDIINILGILTAKRNGLNNHLTRYKTSDIYRLLSLHYKKEKPLEESSEKAIEQRVRRAIAKALKNIASIGLEDFSDTVFSAYSNSIFDFSEVRAEMEYLKGRKHYRGKINVKKFLEGIMLFAQGL